MSPLDPDRPALGSAPLRSSPAEAAVIGVIAIAATAASILAAPGIGGWAGAGLAVLMLTIAVIDGRSFIIPDRLNAAAFVLGLVNAALPWWLLDQWNIAILDVAFAIVRSAILTMCFLAIRVGYQRIRQRPGLGLGDVKLAAVAGVWLDWVTIPVAVEIAALSALAFYVLLQVISGRPLRAIARLPFGLFFAPAIWLGWLIEKTLLVA